MERILPSPLRAVPRRIPTVVNSAPELRTAWQATRSVAALDLRPLDRVLRLDDARGLMEVHAGARWEDIDAWLEASPEAKAAWAGPSSRDATAVSVNDSIARNAPGYGPTQGPIADDIEALTLLTADGELHRLSRASEPGLFRLVIGGHGLFGLVYSVTLRLVPRAAAPLEQAEMPSLPELASSVGSVPLADAGVHATVRATAAVFIPTQRAGSFMLQALEAAQEHRVVVARADASRVIEGEAVFLHPTVADRVEFSFDLCRSANLCARVRLEEACRRLAQLALEHGGGLCLAHGSYASREQAEASYPMLAGFLAERQRHDPAGHFGNAWSRHYTQLLRREACAMRWAA